MLLPQQHKQKKAQQTEVQYSNPRMEFRNARVFDHNYCSEVGQEFFYFPFYIFLSIKTSYLRLGLNKWLKGKKKKKIL